MKAVAEWGLDVDASTPMVPDDENDVDREDATDEAADSDPKAVSASDASTGASSTSRAEDAEEDVEDAEDEPVDDEEDEAPSRKKRPAVDQDDDGDEDDEDDEAPPRKKRPIVDDDDEDEEGDDEEDEDEEDDDDAAELARRRRAKRRAQRLKSSKKKRRKKRVKRPPVPKTEPELDSPNRSTAFMIWSLVGVTLLLWGFARTACNFNPPQVDKPKLAELDVLAREPKDAAIEFELRLRERRFDISQKLAAKAGEEIVASARKACGASCTEIEHGKILCQAAVMARNAAGARVRVGCQQDGKWDYQLLTLLRETNEWRISAREPTEGPPPVGAGATATATAPVPPVPPPSASASAEQPKPKAPPIKAPRPPVPAAP